MAARDSTAKTPHRHGRLFVLDGANIAYRAFFALPENISTSTGFPTNALYGFCMMAMKILNEYRPDGVIVAWDSAEKTFRHVEFEEYKAHRKPMPDSLSLQWPYFEELAAAFGFVNLCAPGWEADDILATLARQADAEGRELVIVTGDRDALQLVTEHVGVMASTRGVTEVKMYDPKGVQERYGIPPRLVPDLIGLKGDTSDNIPGIPGIGEKTAAQLLAEFGSLEAVFENLDRVKGDKRRELLREHEAVARMSKGLARLDRDAPIEIHRAEVAPHRIDRQVLRELFVRFEFSTLIDRLNQLPTVGDESGAVGTAEAADDMPDTHAAWEFHEVGRDGLAREIPWKERLGVAIQTGDAGERLWLVEGPVERARARVVGLAADLEGPLRELLRRGPRVCHDLKGSPGLRDLLAQADHDTFLAGYLLDPGRRSYDLWELSSEARVSVRRGEGPLAAAAEAAAVLGLAEVQEAELRSQGMWRLFQEVELPLTRVLADMETAGIHLDCYRLGEITAKLQDQMEGLEDAIHTLAGGEFNIGSTQKLGEVLFERLALPPQRKTKTGYSTDAKTLEALRGSHPIVEKLLTHRELSKLLSTYLLALPAAVDPKTDRLHTTFHQTVASTGRLSSSDPNLQNIPVRTTLGAQIRECFTAEEGNLLVVADYSQIELRIMAHLSQEPTLLEAFERGEDIHLHTAAEVFDVDEEAVDSTQRRYAKAVNFGIMYGI